MSVLPHFDPELIGRRNADEAESKRLEAREKEKAKLWARLEEIEAEETAEKKMAELMRGITPEGAEALRRQTQAGQTPVLSWWER
jgi:hypothetical protein